LTCLCDGGSLRQRSLSLLPTDSPKRSRYCGENGGRLGAHVVLPCFQRRGLRASSGCCNCEPCDVSLAVPATLSCCCNDKQVSEGANTMDIGRTLIKKCACGCHLCVSCVLEPRVHADSYLPRHRLDAGTYGTMGVGLGFAIAAAVVHPGKKIVAIEGDSAFGFSGLELEVACRFKLPIVVIIINNNGIYQVLEPCRVIRGVCVGSASCVWGVLRRVRVWMSCQRTWRTRP
jgi:hypothetical protein